MVTGRKQSSRAAMTPQWASRQASPAKKFACVAQQILRHSAQKKARLLGPCLLFRSRCLHHDLVRSPGYRVLHFLQIASHQVQAIYAGLKVLRKLGEERSEAGILKLVEL